MNHGPAFQALWRQLRVEVRALQDKGYYGDGTRSRAPCGRHLIAFRLLVIGPATHGLGACRRRGNGTWRSPGVYGALRDNRVQIHQ